MDPIFEFMQMEKKQKVDKYRILNEKVIKGQTLFTGSSLMEYFPINELLMTEGMDQIVYNRGIGGYTIPEMLETMEEQIFGVEPSKIFINIGTNDLSMPNFKLETLLSNYEKVLTQIKERLPEATVYMMAYYPVNEVDKVPDGEWGMHMFDSRNNETIERVNVAVEELAAKMGNEFINVNEGLRDERGKLKKEFTIEGVHMYANAYRVILQNMKKYL